MKALKSAKFEVFLAALTLSAMLSFGYGILHGFSYVMTKSEIADVYGSERGENIVVVR